jgi:hypothetical protein
MMPTFLNACKTVFSNDIRLLTAGFVAYGVTYAVNAVGCSLLNEESPAQITKLEVGRKLSLIGVVSTAVGYLSYSLLQSRLAVVPLGFEGKIVLVVQAFLFYALARKINVNLTGNDNSTMAYVRQLFLELACFPLAGYAPAKHAIKWAAGMGAICGAFQNPPLASVKTIAKFIWPAILREHQQEK